MTEIVDRLGLGSRRSLRWAVPVVLIVVLYLSLIHI